MIGWCGGLVMIQRFVRLGEEGEEANGGCAVESERKLRE